MTRATRVNPFLIGSNAESSNEPSGTPRWYGTRISTVILVREDGQVIFIERDIAVLDNNGQPIPGTSQRKEVFHAQ
jgi:uncharacterized protein with NRDE domain